MARKKKPDDYGTGIPLHEVEALARVLLPDVSFQKDGEMLTGGDLFVKKGGKIRKTP